MYVTNKHIIFEMIAKKKKIGFVIICDHLKTVCVDVFPDFYNCFGSFSVRSNK